MKAADCLLAVFIALVWGLNFIFVKLSLNELPPITLCALRFILASIPAVFFISKPNLPWKWLCLYGTLMFGLQFILLFVGLHLGISPGVASLIAQLQIFFSMFLAALFLNERPHAVQILGACIAFIGVGIVWEHLDDKGSILGFVFVIAAAFSWGLGNLVTKKMPHGIKGMSLVVWGSLVSSPILTLAAYLTEGYQPTLHAITHLSWTALFSIIYIVYVSTWFGYGAWNKLLKRYPVNAVVPFTLLVPIFGMMGSYFVFDEALPLWKISAGMIVILGLCVHLFGSRVYIRFAKRLTTA